MNFFKRFKRGFNAVKHRVNPIRPWGFIRVFSEMKTFPLMLESIRGAVDKGVIATHVGNSDETVAYAKRFCEDNPGFIFFEYPHTVVPAFSERYLEHPPYENTLAAYYNAVLAHIPAGAWFVKLDADQIYDARLLKEAFRLIQTPRDRVDFPRLNVVINAGHPEALSYICPQDQWVLKKRAGVHFKNVMGYTPSHDFYAYEMLVSDTPFSRTAKALTIHFPYEKTWRNLPADEPTYPLETILEQIPRSELTDFVSRENVERICARLMALNGESEPLVKK